jgi:hypothetical protein
MDKWLHAYELRRSSKNPKELKEHNEKWISSKYDIQNMHWTELQQLYLPDLGMCWGPAIVTWGYVVALFGMGSFFHIPLTASAFSCAHTNVCNDNPGYDCTNPNQPPDAKGCPNDDSYIIYNAQPVL